MSSTTGEDLLAERVRALRKAKGWTQGDLAQRLGMNRVTVTHIEGGQRQVTVNEWLAIAYVLDVAPIYLVTPWSADERLTVGAVLEDGADPASVETGMHAIPVSVARAWVRGEQPLPKAGTTEARQAAEWFYFTHVPADEWRPPARKD